MLEKYLRCMSVISEYIIGELIDSTQELEYPQPSLLIACLDDGNKGLHGKQVDRT